MSRKVRLAYAEFLASEPVMTTAIRKYPDAKDLEVFLKKVYGIREGVEGSDRTPSWYLFEEIGWPEGERYVRDSMCRCGHMVNILYSDPMPVIDTRLDLRRRHWKAPGKATFIKAHALLLALV